MFKKLVLEIDEFDDFDDIDNFDDFDDFDDFNVFDGSDDWSIFSIHITFSYWLTIILSPLSNSYKQYSVSIF